MANMKIQLEFEQIFDETFDRFWSAYRKEIMRMLRSNDVDADDIHDYMRDVDGAISEFGDAMYEAINKVA